MGPEPQNTEGEQPKCRPLSLRFFLSCASATLPEGEGAAKKNMTFKQVFTIFKDYMEQDKELEVVKTKKGYLRIIWSGGLPYCEDGYLCRTPEELFDRLLSDCQSFHENRLTKGCRELTPEDTERAMELCRPYLEMRKEAEGQ